MSSDPQKESQGSTATASEAAAEAPQQNSPQPQPGTSPATAIAQPVAAEENEGSPLIIGLVLLGVIGIAIILAVVLGQDSAPPIEEVRGKLYQALGEVDGVESTQRLGSRTMEYTYRGEKHTLQVQRMRVEDGIGRVLVEVEAEGEEPFHANVLAEPDGDEWQLMFNEEEEGIERLWTRIERRLIEEDAQPAAPATPAGENPVVLIVTSEGDIELELFEDRYPNSVANFITLAEQGFYEGTKFHRIIDGFMIQGGDPNTIEGLEPGRAGTGGPGYAIPDEHDEETVFDRPGQIAYANSGPNTSGSQFFITLGPAPQLNGQYNLFGRVIAGMETVQRIGQVPVSPNPANPSEPSWPEEIVEVHEVEIIQKRDHDYNVRRVE